MTSGEWVEAVAALVFGPDGDRLLAVLSACLGVVGSVLLASAVAAWWEHRWSR